LSGRLYPNGEFTLGYLPSPRLTQKEKRYNDSWENQFEFVIREFEKGWLGFTGLMNFNLHRFLAARSEFVSCREFTKTDRLTGKKTTLVQFIYAIRKPPLIGLSLVSNSHKEISEDVPIDSKPNKRRGLKGITPKGKRTIRNTAFLLQKTFGKKRLGFLTVTLPSFGDRPDLGMILAHDWSELVRQFTQEINRAIERKDKVALWTGCTEIQEKRLEKYGEVAPHLHLVYLAHNGNFDWYITADEFRSIWKRIIEARIKHFTNEEIEVNTKASIDAKQVKKDAGNYLGKYMSKGGDIVKKMIEKGFTDLVPTAWWHCCLKLKRILKAMMRELPSDLKLAVKQGVNLVERGVCIYLFDVEIKDRHYGWVGKLKRTRKLDKKLLQVLE
jgi:hypothetical protein